MTDYAVPDGSVGGSGDNAAGGERGKLKFAVGAKVFLEVTVSAQPVRVSAEVLGWRHGEYLLTTIPLLDNKQLVAIPGAKIIVRHLLDGIAYGFTTTLVNRLLDPLEMWMLAYPQEVEIKNLQRSPRVAIALKVSVAEGKECYTIDMSAHGALLSVDDDFSMGQKLELTFTLPNNELIHRLEAEVVRIQQSRDTTMVGVNFAEKDPDLRDKIANYLYKGGLKKESSDRSE